VERVRARLRKTAFEALYGPFAWAYDWVSSTFFAGQWRVWQRASLRYLRGERVLEVGMGTGNLQLDLIRAGYRAWGVDLSPQMMRQARAKFRRLGVPLCACRARAQALPFPDACFDSVVSTFPSDYIAHSSTINEIARVLRPGGRLVVVPGGWLIPRDAQSKTLDTVSRLVYGYKSGDHGPDLSMIEEQARQGSSEFQWIVSLRRRMAESGFSLTSYIGSNDRGACLVLVADKQIRPADKSAGY
jgi:ubiquinone/menaquinone biosynthesis C-methylase UbiE